MTEHTPAPHDRIFIGNTSPTRCDISHSVADKTRRPVDYGAAFLNNPCKDPDEPAAVVR
jgi:hypothetical protein